MKQPIEIIQFIKVTSYNLTIDLQGHQDVIKRFVYTAIYKLYHCFCSINELYPKLEINPSHEFSIGILLRSLLMDCILIQHLRFIQLQGSPDTLNENNEEVRKAAYKLIVNGTKLIMNDIEINPNIERTKKGLAYRSMANLFPDVFILNGDELPTVKPGYNFTLAGLHNSSQHPSLLSSIKVYDLYQFYSKYDHLSHWTTALNSDLPLENLLNKLTSAIAMIALNLRDLLIVGTSSEDLIKIVLPYIDRVSLFLKEMAEE
jgi:hypothetical protein